MTKGTTIDEEKQSEKKTKMKNKQKKAISIHANKKDVSDSVSVLIVGVCQVCVCQVYVCVECVCVMCVLPEIQWGDGWR